MKNEVRLVGLSLQQLPVSMSYKHHDRSWNMEYCTYFPK